ncbi:hypothetical protein [uncultured Spirosoma sp.]|uniref:hypothetical protein n=1 Tax=uncultured Spirosoma sp. TaxID=278208 RepID=UPI0025867BBD|nr:hypothetical protein [uncultured Spirosoma sp.]
MQTNQKIISGRRGRFRISLLLLAVLFLTKIWTLGGHANPPTAVVADEGGQDGFVPVNDENKRVWGLMGDVMGLFGSGNRSPSEIDRELEDERARREATDQANRKRYEKEYDERRAEEREQREQEMYEAQDRRRAEEQAHYEQQQR